MLAVTVQGLRPHEGQQLDESTQGCTQPTVTVQANKLHSYCRTITSEDLAVRALRRRRVFPSRQAVTESYGSRSPFKSFHREALAAYVNHGFSDLPGAYALVEELFHA